MMIDENKKSTITLLQRCLWVCNTIFHQSISIVTFFILWIILRNNDISNKIIGHMVWSTVAYVPLMAEGIILFTESNTWTQKIQRANKYYIHGFCLTLSVVTVSVGIILAIVSKNELGYEHFKSDHAISGLVSWMLCLLSVILGLFANYSQQLRFRIPPVYLKLAHNVFGLAAYIIGISAILFGLQKHYFADYVTDIELKGIIGLLKIVVAWSIVGSFISMYNEIKAAVA